MDGPAANASSDSSFTLTSPVAGDIWAADSEQTITWTYTGDPGDKVNLTLYAGGKSLYRIATNVPVGSGGSGSYTWKIQSVYVPEGSNYSIRIFTPSTLNRTEAYSQTFSVTHQTPGQPLSSSNQTSGGGSVEQNQTATGQSGAASQSDITVILNGQRLSFDQPPVIIGGSTLVPMRAIFEALGATVDWDAANQMVTAAKGDTTIKLIIGLGTAQVNGHETALSQAAQIIGGRTMVPLRFVAESLQAEVKWEGSTRTITINLSSSGTTELPANGRQVVDYFFSSLGSGQVDNALSLMDTEILGNSSTQSMWRDSFNSFDTLQVISIEDWNPGEWSIDQQTYKVQFSLQLKPGAPETMWMDGVNTRWATVRQAAGAWKISVLATGP